MKEVEQRTVGLYFKVSPREKAIIESNMAEVQIQNQRAYLRKMAVNGYIIHIDMSFVKELLLLIRKSSDNINQIAHRVNATGNFYEQDLEDLQGGMKNMFISVNKIMEKVNQL